MKLLVSVLFSLVVLLSGSKNFLFLADYSVNKDYYEQLCINKNKPGLECHGKCQMQEKSEKQTSYNDLLTVSFEFNILPNTAVEMPFLTIKFPENKQKKYYHSTDIVLKGFYENLPHPPQSLV